MFIIFKCQTKKAIFSSGERTINHQLSFDRKCYGPQLEKAISSSQHVIHSTPKIVKKHMDLDLIDSDS